jgi:hypothetical protein
VSEEGKPVVYKGRRVKMAPTLGVLTAVCFGVLAMAVPDASVPALRWLLLTLACLMFVGNAILGIMLGFTSIQVSPKGLEIRHWRLLAGSFAWSDIVEFFPERLLGRDYVAFTLSSTYAEKRQRSQTAAIHRGRLPDTYGFTAEALAKLLNAQRKLAVRELRDQEAAQG